MYRGGRHYIHIIYKNTTQTDAHIITRLNHKGYIYNEGLNPHCEKETTKKLHMVTSLKYPYLWVYINYFTEVHMLLNGLLITYVLSFNLVKRSKLPCTKDVRANKTIYSITILCVQKVWKGDIIGSLGLSLSIAVEFLLAFVVNKMWKNNMIILNSFCLEQEMIVTSTHIYLTNNTKHDCVISRSWNN